jgi:hypothetical protein
MQRPASAGLSLTDFSSLKMEALHSFGTSVHTRTTWCHIPENGIIQKCFLFMVGLSQAVQGDVRLVVVIA